MNLRWVPAIVSAALLVAACTDTNVYIELEPDAPILRMQIEADVCSPDSIVEEVPYKILFVIDTSLSNKWNDAEEHRVVGDRIEIQGFAELHIEPCRVCDGFTACIAVSVVGGCQSPERKGIKRVDSVDVQVPIVGIALRVSLRVGNDHIGWHGQLDTPETALRRCCGLLCCCGI